MKVEFNLKKRYLAVFLIAFGLLIWAGVVLAGVSHTEPYHPAGQVELASGDSLTDALGTLPAGGDICTSASPGSDGNCIDNVGGHGDGTDCIAGQAARGVDANGNAELCWTPAVGGPETDPTVISSVKDGVSWTEVSSRPPIYELWGGVQASTYYDDDSGYYVDSNSISKLNDVRARFYYDLDDTTYYVNPSGDSRFYGSIRASSMSDRNDPSNRYIDPSSHSQIGSLTAFGDIYALSGLGVNRPFNIRTPIGSATWEMELFVWENSQCNNEGNSIGCHGGRCLCIKAVA